MQSTNPISFDNTNYAFAYKTDQELQKAHFLFRLMGNPFVIKWGLQLMPLAIRFRIPFTQTIIRQTIFKQFVGGETLEETAAVAQKLESYAVQVILDYGVEGGEGEAAFDEAASAFIQVIQYASSQQNIPFMSIKVTGIAAFALLEKLQQLMQASQASSLMGRYTEALALLNEEEKAAWARSEKRLQQICENGFRLKVKVLVDAEESWIQNPVDAITMLMMNSFNKEIAVVYNTIQLYRHDRLAFLEQSFELAKEGGFQLGVKLVRGAYMEKERSRAKAMAYTDPIQKDKTATDADYNKALQFCIARIDQIAMIVASHNEASNLYTTQLMQAQHLDTHHPHIHFSQLYGMSDNITFNLAKSGCSVSKYLPFGPIKDVVPYLMRRAQENSSVAGQTGRELGLIEKERVRRKNQ